MTTLAITRRNASPYLPVASDETTMHTEIETVVNGGLGNANFLPVAALANTLAGLSPRKGKVAILRTYNNTTLPVDVSYNNMRFIYDDSLGKWVSDVDLAFHQHFQLAPLVAGGYTDLPWNTQINESWLSYVGNLYAQGARPQVWMGAFMNGGTSGTIKARMRIVEHGYGVVWGSTLWHSNELSFTGSTDTYKVLDWHDCNLQNAPNANLQTGAIFVIDLNVSSDAGSPHIGNLTAYLRWVSA